MGDARTDGPGAPDAVPIDAVPAALAGYAVREGEPVITATNDAFEAAFDWVSAGTPVRDWLRDARGATVDGVCSSLAEGHDIDTEVGVCPTNGERLAPERYRLRTTDLSGDGTVDGYVLVTDPAGDADSVEVDRIASVISHDLRNPLDVANAHLRAARETGASEHFDQVRESHERMERIIRDVLTLARGESALDTVSGVDIGSVAADAWATVDTETASITIDDDLPTAEAAPDRLQRLFENLFRNCVEHGSTSSRTQSDDATRESGGGGSEPGQQLRVRVGTTRDGFFVADDGVGIPEMERAKVFDPGYSSAETSGTGLGLTIVERIAEAHGWTVSLTGGSLGGARFEFRLHREEAAGGSA